MSWWNWKVTMFFAASSERLVCHFGQYGLTWLSNMNLICKFTLVIHWLPRHVRMGKAVSSTLELVDSENSDDVNLFHFPMWAVSSMLFPHWAGPLFWRVASNMITNDTYDCRAAGLLNSTVPINSLWRRISSIIPSTRAFQAYIHWSPHSVKGNL
jgi:hypothetical protein